MKLALLLTGVGLAAVLVAPATVSAREDCNVLLGGEENPPVVSDGTGDFFLRIRDDGDLRYRLNYDFPDTTTVLAAHLHVANPGTNGGVAAFLCGGTTTPPCESSDAVIRGTITADDVLETTTAETIVLNAGDIEGLAKLIRDGAVYVNVHTMAHPGGELRCQVAPRER